MTTNVVKLRNAAEVYIELRGSTQRERNNVPDELTVDLKDLLHRAGYAGTFILRVTGDRSKGTRHTQGLRIGAPHHDVGVEIFGQYKGNDSRYRYILHCGEGDRDQMRFYQRLKEALNVSEITEPEVVEEIHNGSDNTISSVEENVDVESSSDHKGKEAGNMIGFSDDPENLELAVIFMADKADENGHIPRQVCSEVLVREFGFTSLRATGSLHKKFCSEGLLERVEDDNVYKIAPRLLERHASERAAKKQATEESVVATAPVVPTPESPILARLAKLEASAAEKAELDGALAALQKKRVEHEYAIGELERRLSELRQEDAGFAAEEESLHAKLTGIAEDAAKLLEIKRLLGL